MKLKHLVAAVAVATAAFSANADTTYDFDTDPVRVGATGASSFSNVSLGTITVGSLSNITGELWYISALQQGVKTILTDAANFTLASLTTGSTVAYTTSTASAFSFSNVAAGTYALTASGTITDLTSKYSGTYIGASYSVTAVPEPETYAMFLAGLGIMGAIARRRTTKAS